MKINKLTETLGVSEQVTVEDIPAIAEAGYQVLINNRPDGEAEGQPSSAEIAAAAEAAGLDYRYFPITAVNFPGPDVATIGDLFDDSSKAVFAFCRTGTRCTNLWITTRSAQDKATATAHAKVLGYDLTMAAKVNQNHEG